MRLDDLPKGKCYKRIKWNKGSMFAWDDESGYYSYVEEIDSDGNIIFAPAHKSYNYNKKSKVGYKILIGDDLECVEDNNKTSKMNKNYIGNYSLVDCVYVDSIDKKISSEAKSYVFKIDTALHESIKEQDLVVVDSVNGLGICKIVKVYCNDITQENIRASNKAKAWVVNKVNTDDHIKRISNTDRRKIIEMELTKRRKAIEEEAVWKLLAEKDKTFAKLLEELESLS